MVRALFDLGGKPAIVTGGSRGLGFAIARAFGHAGAAVMIASENAAECAAAQVALEDEGLTSDWRVCAVGDDDAQSGLVDATAARFGGIDILVANAGISGPMRGSTAMDAADYR